MPKIKNFMVHSCLIEVVLGIQLVFHIYGVTNIQLWLLWKVQIVSWGQPVMFLTHQKMGLFEQVWYKGLSVYHVAVIPWNSPLKVRTIGGHTIRDSWGFLEPKNRTRFGPGCSLRILQGNSECGLKSPLNPTYPPSHCSGKGLILQKNWGEVWVVQLNLAGTLVVYQFCW